VASCLPRPSVVRLRAQVSSNARPHIENVPFLESLHLMAILMNRYAQLTTTVIATLSIAGCGHMNLTFVHYEGADKACISGSDAGFMSFFTSASAHAAIRSIDGEKTSPTGEKCVKPGEHQIGITATKGLGPQNTAFGYITLQMAAGRYYEVIGSRTAAGFEVTIRDKTAGTDVLTAPVGL
jgi:hypothetical protein